MKKIISILFLMPLLALAQPIRFQYYTTNLSPALSVLGTNAVNNIISTNRGVTNIVLSLTGGSLPTPASVGDMIYYGVGAWVGLPKGSPQQMLAMDSSDPRPVWTWDLSAMSNFPAFNLSGLARSGTIGTAGAAGKILQYNGTFAEWVTPTNVIAGSATNVFETAFGVGLTATTNTFLYDVALDTNYVNSLITNRINSATNNFALSVPVIPNNVNLDKLFNFRNAVINSNRPVKIMITTDQVDNGGEWPGAIMTPLRGLLLSEGGIQSGGSAEGCLLHVLSPANAWQPADDANPEGIYLGTANYINLTNGGYMTFYRNSSVNITNVYADTFKLFYLQEPRGATFEIQTNNAGSTWGTLATGDMVGTGTNLIVTNFTLPLANYSVRVLNTGAGTNRIRTASLYNSTTNQIFSGGFLVNAGGDWSIMAGAYTNVSWPYWKAMDPDLIILQDEGPTNDVVAINSLEQMFTNVCPHADVIYIGQFWASHDSPGTSNDIAYYNAGLRSQAVRYGRGFFDSQFYIPNKEVHDYYVSIGLINIDGAHVNKGGSDLLVAGLWKSFFAENLVNPPYHTLQKYSGKGAQFLNGYVGNLYGGVTNNGILVFNDGGNYAYMYSPGSGSMSLRLTPNGRDTISSDASDLVSFGGTNGTYWWSGSSFNVAGQVWPDGGWTFGHGGPSSPSANNIQVMGNIKWGTGATNGLASAGSLINGVGTTNFTVYGNGGGLTNAVELVAGTNVFVTTNALKRGFTIDIPTQGIFGNGLNLSNAVDLIQGTNVFVTTNANKRSFTIDVPIQSLVGNGSGLSNAVDLIQGTNVFITTNANKRSFTVDVPTQSLVGNGSGLSNAVDLLPGINMSVTTNANKRSFTVSTPANLYWFSDANHLSTNSGVYFLAGTGSKTFTLPDCTATPVGTMITAIVTNLSGAVIVSNANSQTILGQAVVHLGAANTTTNRITVINDGQNWN